MSIEKLSDESVLRFYENIRHQVLADQDMSRRFIGETAKQQAQRLRDEIDRRRLNCKPIDWNT